MLARRIGFLSAAWRWWPLVFLATGAGGLLAYVHASGIPPTYEAEATLVAEARGGDSARQNVASTLLPTYGELVRSEPFLRTTLARVGLTLSPAELRGAVRGEADRESRQLTIRVRAGEPEAAVALANGLARDLDRFASDTVPAAAPTADGDSPAVDLRIVESAAEADQVRPQRRETTEAGAFAGLFAGLAIAVFVESSRRRVRDERDLAQVAPAILGSVNGAAHSPEIPRWLAPGRPPSADIGAYGLLAARIGEAADGPVPRSLLMLGAQEGAGSAAVALGLSTALATGGRVALVDLDSRREVLRLAERTASVGRPTAPVRRADITLDCFPLGPGDALLLALPRRQGPSPATFRDARALVGALLARADVLVVHAASLRRSPDALVWARTVDGAVLVARRDHTTRASVRAALASLEFVGIRLIGTVLHEGPGIYRTRVTRVADTLSASRTGRQST